jgi:hypothetical protein
MKLVRKRKTTNNNSATIEMVFDNRNSADAFVAYWLDGGGDGGGNLDIDTDYDESSKWDKEKVTKLRIRGTCELHVEA